MIHGVTGVKLIADQISPQLANQAALGDKVQKVACFELKKIVVAHYRNKNKKPNRLGGSRTNFWHHVSLSVSSGQISGKTIRVKIMHPHAAIHVHGGTIRAKKAKYLTIPINTRAHGRRARDFEVHAEGRVLVDANGDRLFALAKEAKINKDPTALPDDRDVAKKIERIIKITIGRS